MDCAEIRDSFVRGALPSSPAVQAHLASCEHCRDLFEHGAKLGRSLAAEAALASALPESLFSELEQRIEHETGLRAWLRSRPSRVRYLVVALTVLAAVIIGGVLRPRTDFAAYPDVRVLFVIGGYFAFVLIALQRELFSSLRVRTRAESMALLALGLGLPFLVALAPATEAARAAGPEGALRCFSYGALLTLPSAALLWAFDRDDRLSLRTVCLSAAALGLSANLLLELHCANGNLRHLLFGHASLGLAWLLAWALVGRFNRPVHRA